MINILEILNREIEERKRVAKLNYQKLQDQSEEIKKLRAENEILRKDLFELSQEHFKIDSSKIIKVEPRFKKFGL